MSAERLFTIKEIRGFTGLSQDKFAKKYHISPSTLRKWEQGISQTPEHYLWLLNEYMRYEGYFYDAVKEGKISTVSDVYKEMVLNQDKDSWYTGKDNQRCKIIDLVLENKNNKLYTVYRVQYEDGTEKDLAYGVLLSGHFKKD